MTKHDVQESWKRKSDEQVLAAAATLSDYTLDAQEVLHAEMRRRGLSLETARHCPACGFWNTAEASRCDCGWDFVTGQFISPKFVPIRAPRPTLDQAVARNLNIGLGLVIGSIVVRRLLGSTPMNFWLVSLGIGGTGHLVWAMRQFIYVKVADRRTARMVSSVVGILISFAFVMAVIAVSSAVTP